MKEIKYEYFIYTWGGFYNHTDKHGYKSEPRWFDSKEERNEYLKVLNETCNKLGTWDAILAVKTSEGYHTREVPTIHRVVEYEGKRYYSTNKWNWPEDFITLEYFNEHKWYPGFNDDIIEEELKKQIDYNKVIIIQEWITGAFDVNNEKY
jgi:hypothetical protein